MHKLFAYFSDSGHLLWATMLALSLQKSKCAHFCRMKNWGMMRQQGWAFKATTLPAVQHKNGFAAQFLCITMSKKIASAFKELQV